MVEKTIEELLDLLNKNQVTSNELVKESLSKAHLLQEEYERCTKKRHYINLIQLL